MPLETFESPAHDKRNPHVPPYYSQAIKTLDDQTLNVHLSSLCNSLTDAAGDVTEVGGHMRDGVNYGGLTELQS